MSSETCDYITSKNRKCKKKRQQGSNFCHIHKNFNSSSVPEAKSSGSLGKLPKDLRLYILDNLGPKDLARVSPIDKDTSEMVNQAYRKRRLLKELGSSELNGPIPLELGTSDEKKLTDSERYYLRDKYERSKKALDHVVEAYALFAEQAARQNHQRLRNEYKQIYNSLKGNPLLADLPAEKEELSAGERESLRSLKDGQHRAAAKLGRDGTSRDVYDFAELMFSFMSLPSQQEESNQDLIFESLNVLLFMGSEYARKNNQREIEEMDRYLWNLYESLGLTTIPFSLYIGVIKKGDPELIKTFFEDFERPHELFNEIQFAYDFGILDDTDIQNAEMAIGWTKNEQVIQRYKEFIAGR